MSTLRDTYDEYLGHIALNLAFDHSTLQSTDTVLLSDITAIMVILDPEQKGAALIPHDDIVTALARLHAKDIVDHLHHPTKGPQYTITGKTRSYIEAESLNEGSVIWKCRTIQGYVQMVLEAMYTKRQEGF